MAGDDAIVPLMRVAAWIVAAVGTLIALLLLTEQPIKPVHVALNASAGVVALVALWCLHIGRTRWAALWLIWAIWCVSTMVTIFNGGVRGPNLLNYPVMIVFSGWVLGARSTRWLAAITTALLMLLLWADTQALLPPANYGNRWAYGVYLSGIVSLTAYMTLKSRRSYLARLEQSERTLAELAVREQELRKLLRAVEQSPEAVVITDLAQRIEFVNDAFVHRSGYAREAVLGQPSADSSTNGLAPEARAQLQETLARGETWSGELGNRRRDGTPYAESVLVAPIRQPDGRITHWVELKQDITARRQAEAEIHRLAHYDTLTGLPNRTVLIERLETLRERPGREPQLHALLLFNLSRFKTFNDARGNEMGDSLLRAVAQRLLGLVPAQGLLARQAADEFAIVLPLPQREAAAAARHALAFAETVHADLMRPMPLDGEGGLGQTSACAGITLYPQGVADTPREALQRAGTALHGARAGGGGRTAFFEPGMAEAAEARFRVERELRHAILTHELVLYLQPQVDVHGVLRGAEALVRWQHPELGLLLPGRFIAIAEESELIVALGDWVLEHALHWLAHEAPPQPGFRLSVNISPRQFSDVGFVRRLHTALASTGADPHRLTLEVTEGVVIGDIDEAILRMRELAALGIEFSLDDFGTGYSSLSYLKRLPIQEIKIDKSFVQDAPVDGDDAALVESILSVAQRLHLRVVAEGVETSEQAAFLARHQASVVYQGYYFGRPSPAHGWRWPGVPAR